MGRSLVIRAPSQATLPSAQVRASRRSPFASPGQADKMEKASSRVAEAWLLA